MKFDHERWNEDASSKCKSSDTVSCSSVIESYDGITLVQLISLMGNCKTDHSRASKSNCDHLRPVANQVNNSLREEYTRSPLCKLSWVVAEQLALVTESLAVLAEIPANESCELLPYFSSVVQGHKHKTEHVIEWADIKRSCSDDECMMMEASEIMHTYSGESMNLIVRIDSHKTYIKSTYAVSLACIS